MLPEQDIATRTILLHAMLHLYSEMSKTKKFYPVPARNKVLLDFLKSNEKKYKPSKKVFKFVLTKGKNKSKSLEEVIEYQIEVINKLELELSNTTDIHSLYELLDWLSREHQIDNQFFKDGDKTVPDVLYVIDQHLRLGFTKAGVQTDAISLLYQGDLYEEMEGLVAVNGKFDFMHVETNHKTKGTHFTLMAKSGV